MAMQKNFWRTTERLLLHKHQRSVPFSFLSVESSRTADWRILMCDWSNSKWKHHPLLLSCPSSTTRPVWYVKPLTRGGYSDKMSTICVLHGRYFSSSNMGKLMGTPIFWLHKTGEKSTKIIICLTLISPPLIEVRHTVCVCVFTTLPDRAPTLY